MKTEFKVSGMTCGGCERSVQNALTSHKGVTAAKADRTSGTVAVEFDPSEREGRIYGRGAQDVLRDLVQPV